MKAANRIIVALDRPNLGAACDLAQAVAPHVGGLKVGLELLTAAGAPRVVAALAPHTSMLFFDAKFNDIPNTVAGAVRAAAGLGVGMQNVHALGGIPMMEAAVAANREGADAAGKPAPILLAVTLLTSYAPQELQEVGLTAIDTEACLHAHVVHLARLAQDAGCDGVVASPHEVAEIRAACGADFTIVTPGVRPTWAARGDQKRIMTPYDATHAGADYLVIGRPITSPPEELGSPADAVKKIVAEL